MNDKLNEIFKDLCAEKCFFEKAKEGCKLFIKEKFPSLSFISTSENIQLQRSIHSYCKPYKNRKQIYMFVLSKQIYIACKDQKQDKDGCLNYVFEKLLNESKKFDIEQSSTVFQTLKSKFDEIEKIYQETPTPNLTDIAHSTLLSSKDIIEDSDLYSSKDTAGAINNYIKKIVSYYHKEKFDPKSREAFVDNILLHLADDDMRNYFEHKVFDYKKEKKQRKILTQNLLSIKDELELFLNQEEISYLISAILYEFSYKEKFFAFINKRIPMRIIDFYRREGTTSTIEYQDNIIDEEEIFFAKEESRDFFTIIDKIAYPAEKIILFLKFGIKLTKKIEEILDTFTHNEIYTIRLYLRGAGELTPQIDQKIKRLKEVLFSEMRDKKGKILKGLREDRVNLKPQIAEKLYKIEPLSYKEISLLFGQQPKWANKKREQFFKRIEGIEYDRV